MKKRRQQDQKRKFKKNSSLKSNELMNEFKNAISASRNVSSMIDNKSIMTHHSSISIKHKVEDDVFITNDEDIIANDEITIYDNIASERKEMKT